MKALLPRQKIIYKGLITSELFISSLERELQGISNLLNCNGRLIEPLNHHVHPRKHAPRGRRYSG